MVTIVTGGYLIAWRRLSSNSVWPAIEPIAPEIKA